MGIYLLFQSKKMIRIRNKSFKSEFRYFAYEKKNNYRENLYFPYFTRIFAFLLIAL